MGDWQVWMRRADWPSNQRAEFPVEAVKCPVIGAAGSGGHDDWRGQEMTSQGEIVCTFFLASQVKIEQQ